MTVRRRAFSLIELTIVVVILGIVAAIALPRMSQGAAGAADSALIADLAVVRNAIDLYEAEHVGLRPDGDFVVQMTQYTGIDGSVSATKDATHIYGPYLRDIPPLPVGSKKGETGVVVDKTAGGVPPAGGAGDAWYYNMVRGEFRANLAGAEKDTTSALYNRY